MSFKDAAAKSRHACGMLCTLLLCCLACALACAPSAALAEESEETRYYLGEAVNAGADTGYTGASAIQQSDVHYGWRLGRFSVTGFTRATSEDGTPVFLKNVGDTVALWFNLEQNIDALGGNEALRINEDTNGYDERLGVAKQDFGRGTLIVRYTDYQNNQEEPQVYVNYLSANAEEGANTQVQLFEEGDYEVVLDYEVKNSVRVVPLVNLDVLPEVTNYTIRFSFKVHNGNCMVYPMAASTGDELTDSAFTQKGFRLDLTRSRYLDIDAKKEVLSDDGSSPDVRSCADLYTTARGENMLDSLIRLLDYAALAKCAVVVYG